jgi:hypothetical protein
MAVAAGGWTVLAKRRTVRHDGGMQHLVVIIK